MSRLRSSVLGSVLAGGIVTFAPGCASSGDGATDVLATSAAGVDPEADADARRILAAAMLEIASAERLGFEAEIGYDVVQPSGQKIEFGATRRVTIQRPDRAIMEFERRDGHRGGLLLDGETIWAWDRTENVYATTDQPGDLDTSVAFAVEELGIPAPMSDLFFSDPHARLTDGLRFAQYGGESSIGGEPCDHVAFRGEETDFQLWISRGPRPLPLRIVITYRSHEGQPQFWAQFSHWDLSPAIPASRFQFTPDPGAERIEFESRRDDDGGDR